MLRLCASPPMSRESENACIARQSQRPDLGRRGEHGSPIFLTGIRNDLEAEMHRLISNKHLGGYVVDTVIIDGVATRHFSFQGEIDRLNSQFAEVPPAHISGPPLLRVFDGDVVEADQDPEPPQAA